MTIYRPHHTAISVRDLDASIAFYRVFGFVEVQRSEFDSATIVHLCLGEFVIELFWYPQNRDTPQLALGFANDLNLIGVKHLALAVEDLDAALCDLVRRGVADESTQVGQLPDGSARWAFIKDPDGSWVEVIQEGRFDVYAEPWPGAGVSTAPDAPAEPSEITRRRAVVFGATGFAGSHISRELQRRGHSVIGAARHGAGHDGVRAGSVHDLQFVADVLAGADLAVLAIRAYAPEQNDLVAALEVIRSCRADIRVGIVGGAGTLRTPGGELLAESESFPETARAEASAQAAALTYLRQSQNLDWFYLSPSAAFGPHTAIEPTGGYRTGTNDLLVDSAGASTVSGEDFAAAFVDEIEHPRHRQMRFTVISSSKTTAAVPAS